MANLVSTLRLALIDTVSGPARAINATLGQLSNAAARNAAALDQMRGRVMDSVGMGYALARTLMAPINAATDFETQLEDIGQKADIPQRRLAALGAELRKLGRQTNQTGSEIATGMDTLMGLGASEADALGLLPAIGRAATAYRASVVDLSTAGYAALDNLKVPADQFTSALDAMAAAGKAGAFELKDMSQYFPALGAGYQALGQKGVPAVADLSAALQIVRKGAGDSSEAANNLKNVIQKIKAPQTIKAFKGLGVNLEKELSKAAKRGLTPIEAIAEITNKALKGDLSKMGDLFSDAQVQNGLRPLIQNIDLYRQIRDDAMKAQGVVQEDYNRRVRNGAGALLRMKATIENLSVSIGSALLPAMSTIIDQIAPMVTRFAELAEAYPRVTAAVIGTTAALIGLRIALTGIQFVGLFAKGGLITAATGALRLASACLALINPLNLVRNAFIGLRLALISTGIGALVVGIAAAGLLIYNNWEGLATLFSAFGSSFKSAIEPIMPMLQPVIDGMARLYNGVSGLLGPIDGLGNSWFAMGRKAGKALGEAIVGVTRFLIDMPSVFGAIDWSGIPRRLFDSFLSIDWGAVGVRIGASIRNAVGALADMGSHVFSSIFGADGGLSAAQGVARSITTTIGNSLKNANWSGYGAAIITALGAALQSTGQLLNGIIKGLFRVDLAAIGAEMVQTLQNGIVRKFDELIAWFREIPAKIRAAIGSIDLTSMIRFPSLPSWAGGAQPAAAVPAVDGARARGGRVVAGNTYRVNERGEELFTPGRSGVISPNAAYRAALAGLSRGSSPGGPSAGFDPYEAYRSASASRSQVQGARSVGDVTVTLSMSNSFTSPSDPNAASKMAQQAADSIRSAVEGAFSD